MQIGIDLHMISRTLFYWSQLFLGQLIIGKCYNELRRIISINILNFKLFHSRWALLWQTVGVHTSTFLIFRQSLKLQHFCSIFFRHKSDIKVIYVEIASILKSLTNAHLSSSVDLSLLSTQKSINVNVTMCLFL